ncbi:hypothetical protein PQI07_22295 [Methylobacterium sp. 092160098-2]|uniref:hypothetical protein n=1 Tax=Methylobacterium sp. 092160098-2 TaxID=3025129 RepID=UPI002381AD28|nr:hypothetical protein [Methylobacterium sp. 092160098-2]MDE4913414.1 hypothetical protein [Methylobacterium sp. 092160098-2]
MAFSKVRGRVLLLLARDMPPLLRRSNPLPLTGGMRPPHRIMQCYEILPAMNDSTAAAYGTSGLSGHAALRDADAC